MLHVKRSIVSTNKNTTKLGSIGENVTKKHLLSKNFGFIEANYRKKCGEIDLIMKYKGKIMFFEVKTVSREMALARNRGFSHETSELSGEVGEYRPEDNVHPLKLNKISKTIRVWMEENRVPESADWSFNVAIVYFSGRQKKCYIKFIWDVII